MEDNSKSIERNLNKLFQKMVIEKYPEYFTQCDISVSYVEEDEDTTVPYYAIFLELEAKSVDGVEEFRRKVGVPLIMYFKGIVKYVIPHNFLFDYELRF
jgi:hypothetical protein